MKARLPDGISWGMVVVGGAISISVGVLAWASMAPFALSYGMHGDTDDHGWMRFMETMGIVGLVAVSVGGVLLVVGISMVVFTKVKMTR